MKLEIEFTRNATIRQTCRAIIEMEDAESIDRKMLLGVLANPSKETKVFVVESQELSDTRDEIEKVDRLTNG